MSFSIPGYLRSLWYKNLAVILIDMQEPFFKNIRTKHKGRILRAQKSALRQCIRHDIPVCVVEYVDCGDTLPDLRELLRKVPRTVTLVKSKDDAFTNRKLAKVLKDWHAGRLILMGINADACVLDTAQSAVRRGYEIITAPALIAGTSWHSENDSIDWYSKNGSVVRSVLPILG
ncbi:MAG: cysteine hydrolase [Candidatus Moranbacteria bacterium]|nr:cysteine hydrolase [Candidatus Moranbacteria bacterium]